MNNRSSSTLLNEYELTLARKAPGTIDAYMRALGTPVDWQQWYNFYQAIIKPLAEAGVEVKLELSIEATGDIDANLVDLSVKESVVQFNPQGKVEVGRE